MVIEVKKKAEGGSIPPLLPGEEEVRYYRAEDFFCNLRFLCRVLNAKDASLIAVRANIYYYRNAQDVPYLDNVLDYWVAIYPYCPLRLTDDWRYLCSIGTFARAFRQHLREIIERSWGLTWTKENVQECLADEVVVRDLVADTLTEIVLLSENLGNDLGTLRKVEPEDVFLDVLDTYEPSGGFDFIN